MNKSVETISHRITAKILLYSLLFIVVVDVMWSTNFDFPTSYIFYAINIAWFILACAAYLIKMIAEKANDPKAIFKAVIRILFYGANICAYCVVYHRITPPHTLNFLFIAVCLPLLIPFIFDVCKEEKQ